MAVDDGQQSREASSGGGVSTPRKGNAAFGMLIAVTVAALGFLTWLIFHFYASHTFDCLDVGLSKVEACDRARQRVISAGPWQDAEVIWVTVLVVVLIVLLTGLTIRRRRPSRR